MQYLVAVSLFQLLENLLSFEMLTGFFSNCQKLVILSLASNILNGSSPSSSLCSCVYELNVFESYGELALRRYSCRYWTTSKNNQYFQHFSEFSIWNYPGGDLVPYRTN
jgi:hypothetical protein